MSWRTVVVSNRAKLDYQMEFLVVRGESTQKIHLSEISVLIIENTAISLTAYLLSELIKHKIKVIFCDEKRNPQSELIGYYGSHDTSAKVNEQIQWPDEIKIKVWTEVVREKIRQQMLFLKELNKPESAMLKEYTYQVQPGDIGNREGFAAKVYFNSLFGKNFTRNDDSPRNAALNYGYSLILSAFTREITANGYITQLGLSHHNVFNPFNFASDLMEPFRPLADRLVYELSPMQFEKDEKAYMLGILNRQIKIKGKKYYFGQAVSIYSKSIFNALNSGDISEIYFYQFE